MQRAKLFVPTAGLRTPTRLGEGRPFPWATTLMNASLKLSRNDRLRSRSEFTKVFRARCAVADERLTVHVAKSETNRTRFGISVSKAVGNAVTRNAVRRRLREAFRTQRHVLPNGYDIVCVAKPKAAEARRDLSTSLVSLSRAAASKHRRRRRLTDQDAV